MIIDLSLLRKNRVFRNVCLGQIISAFGTTMTQVSIPFQIYALTHSTFYTGLVSAFELVFLLLGCFFGGFLADSKEKRQIMLWTEFFLALIMLGLAYNAHQASVSLFWIFLFSALSGIFIGIHRPTLGSLVPRVVPKKELPKVSPILCLQGTLPAIIGPTIAGLCIAKFGATVTYLLDFFTYAVSLAFLITIPKFHPIKSKDSALTNPISAVLDGVKYVRTRQDIIGTYLIDFIAMTFCMPFALFPALAMFYNKAELVGLLYTAPSVGGLLITMFSRWTLKIKKQGQYIILAALLWVVGIMAIGVFKSFYLALAALFFAGLFDMVSATLRMTIWNSTIPKSLRGRLSSFEMFVCMSGPLFGNAILGFIAEVVGLHNAFLLGGVISMILIIAMTVYLPKFWNYKAA